MIHKIVITGGPCAGKTTALSWIQNAFMERGYRVLFVAETATELITGGVTPEACSSIAEFQMLLHRLQFEKEKIYEEASSGMDDEKILIVCDRGALDNKAYLGNDEYNSMISRLGVSEVDLRDGYDAVFHLVTAAKGAAEHYTTVNNTARRETVEEAADVDDRIISAWTGHPHFRVIDNSTDFETKMKRLIVEISSFLGEPEPFEIERKFLIEYPDISALEADPNCRKIDIMQTYLASEDGSEKRVRQRGHDGNYVYYLTEKKKLSGLKRIEIEERLSREKYLELLMSADPAKRPIRKTRYCLTYDSQYFEIDVYPFWDDKAIMEIELCDENAEIRFPENIRIIKEVTDDDEYKNSSLASL